MPLAVTQMYAEIQKLLQAQSGAKDWEQLEVKRITGRARQPVLLRGFCLPDGCNQHTRILIIMESVGRREKVAQQAKERFQLTNREQSMVQNLARGWTNKEIASALGISEPTVKAHIKHIMEKPSVIPVQEFWRESYTLRRKKKLHALSSYTVILFIPPYKLNNTRFYRSRGYNAKITS